jgi:hypothetical protein
MTGRNFSRARDLERVRRQGAQDARDLPNLIAAVLPPAQRAPQPSKQQLRDEAAAAVAAWVTKHGTPQPGRKTDRKNPRQRPTLSEPVVVARWSKNRAGHAITLRLATLEGANVVDLRTFVPDGEGRLAPGRGFCAAVSHLPRLVKEFTKAAERAIELGWLDSENTQ